jgi:hypothetical protein
MHVSRLLVSCRCLFHTLGRGLRACVHRHAARYTYFPHSMPLEFTTTQGTKQSEAKVPRRTCLSLHPPGSSSAMSRDTSLIADRSPRAAAPDCSWPRNISRSFGSRVAGRVPNLSPSRRISRRTSVAFSLGGIAAAGSSRRSVKAKNASSTLFCEPETRTSKGAAYSKTRLPSQWPSACEGSSSGCVKP